MYRKEEYSMTGNNKTVVHVETLDEYQTVLETWFKKGYNWYKNTGEQKFNEYYFTLHNARYLLLDGKDIYRSAWLYPESMTGAVSFKEFKQQQEENNKMETYYVTQEQLDAIKELNDSPWPTNRLLVNSDEHIIDLFYTFNESKDKALLRYLGGDPTIEFKVKDSLYRLWRIDDADDKVYMSFNLFGTPSWTDSKYEAFTASLEEIKEWKTPSWSVEEVD